MAIEVSTKRPKNSTYCGPRICTPNPFLCSQRVGYVKCKIKKRLFSAAEVSLRSSLRQGGITAILYEIQETALFTERELGVSDTSCMENDRFSENK